MRFYLDQLNISFPKFNAKSLMHFKKHQILIIQKGSEWCNQVENVCRKDNLLRLYGYNPNL